MSTACPSLNYIVVETTSDAQRAVELLRSRGLGVATFLILEKQRELASAMAERVDTPEGVVCVHMHVCMYTWQILSFFAGGGPLSAEIGMGLFKQRGTRTHAPTHTYIRGCCHPCACTYDSAPALQLAAPAILLCLVAQMHHDCSIW